MPGRSRIAKPDLVDNARLQAHGLHNGESHMPRTWVLVPTDAGETQPVFVNGPAPGGFTNAAFRVEVGFNDFTLREGGVSGGKVTSRKRENCPARHTQANPVPVILLPVPAAPPVAFGMAPPAASPRPKAAKKKATRKKTAKRKTAKRKIAKKKSAKQKTAPKRKAARKAAPRRKRK